MPNEENISSVNSGADNALTERVRNTQEKMITQIDDFFSMLGLDEPVEFITRSLNDFFEYRPGDSKDKHGNVISDYQEYDRITVYNHVYNATELIMLLVRLKSGMDTLEFLNKSIEKP